jgi:hypothetical protein
MSVSESIRSLRREGMGVTEIARRLNIRYQHAYKVLRDADMLPAPRPAVSAQQQASASPASAPKPPLSVETLVSGGFAFAARWILSDAGDLIADRPLPKAVGVYAFAKGGIVLYVGLATTGLAKRLYFYVKPGVGQPTNLRLQ